MGWNEEQRRVDGGFEFFHLFRTSINCGTGHEVSPERKRFYGDWESVNAGFWPLQAGGVPIGTGSSAGAKHSGSSDEKTEHRDDCTLSPGSRRRSKWLRFRAVRVVASLQVCFSRPDGLQCPAPIAAALSSQRERGTSL